MKATRDWKEYTKNHDTVDEKSENTPVPSQTDNKKENETGGFFSWFGWNSDNKPKEDGK